MQTVEIQGKTLELYDSIEELPITRFHKFNKYLLVDSGVGADLNDVDDHLFKISRYISMDEKQAALKQINNLRSCFYLIIEELSPKHLAFVMLIKSINGKTLFDLSDENIKKIHSELNTKKKSGFFIRLLEKIKKKLDTELDTYFPGKFDSAFVKEFSDKLQRKAAYQLETIISDKDNSDLIQDVEDQMLLLSKPEVFQGKDSIEIAYEKQFEDMCLHIKKTMHLDVDGKMSTLKFFNCLDFIKKNG